MVMMMMEIIVNKTGRNIEQKNKSSIIKFKNFTKILAGRRKVDVKHTVGNVRDHKSTHTHINVLSYRKFSFKTTNLAGILLDKF
jgi:glyceraldehyde-3-phosphate dehydrogenase/erythrose-4-phosphate dehydrogenase